MGKAMKFLFEKETISIRDLIYLIMTISLFVIGGYFACQGFKSDSRENSTTSFLLALLFFLFATIDRFEVVKGFGVEAKTKKLDEKINQADEILEKIKAVAEINCRELVGLIASHGKWGAAEPNYFKETAEKVRQTLSDLGSTDEEIRNVLEDWIYEVCKGVILDLHFDLRREVQSPPLSNEADVMHQKYIVPFNMDQLELHFLPKYAVEFFSYYPQGQEERYKETRERAEKVSDHLRSFINTGKSDLLDEWIVTIVNCRSKK